MTQEALTTDLKNIKHFIWDFDGTLFDTYPIIVGDLYDALLSFGFRADKLEIMEKLLQTVTYAVKYYANLYQIEENALYHAYWARHTSSSQALTSRPMPGIESLLKTILVRGGNHYIYTHRKLDSTLGYLKLFQLEHYFTHIVAPDTEGFGWKPATTAIAYLMEKYHMTPDNTAMVGDREIDVQSGHNAGVYTIHYVCKAVPQALNCTWHFEDYAQFEDALK